MEVELQAAEPAEAAQPVDLVPETVAAPVEGVPELIEGEFVPEYDGGTSEEEESEEGFEGEKKPAKRKKTEKKRELVFDENIGAIVARKKRKPTRDGGWGDTEDY